MFRCVIAVALTLPPALVAHAQHAQAQDQPDEAMGRTLKDWRKDLKSADPSRRDQALRALTRFASGQASEAIPDVLAVLKRHTAATPMDTGVRERALVTLSHLLQTTPTHLVDPAHVREAILVLRGHLKDPQVVLRNRALQALAHVGPDGSAAIDDVIAMIKDTGTWEIRREAVVRTAALLPYEPMKAPRAVSAVTSALNDPAGQVRLAAMDALPQMVSDPEQRKEIAGRVRMATQREIHNEIKVHAIMATALLDPKMANVVELRKLAKDADRGVRKAALAAIAAAGPAPTGELRKSVIDLALATARDADPDIAETAIRLFVPLRALEAIPHLEKIADDTNLPARLRDAADDAIYLLRMK